MCLVDAIPRRWRQILKSYTTEDIKDSSSNIMVTLNQHNRKPIHKCKSKDFYNMLNEQKIAKPTCIETWNTKYNINFTEHQWKKIFILTHNVTTDTNIKELQYKIIHITYNKLAIVETYLEKTS